MRTILNRWVSVGVGLGVLVAVVAVGCSSDSDASSSAGPHIVVTTNILGDVVRQVAGDSGADIEVVMPLGADPHEFAASTKQAESMVDADLLVINGAGFEEGMAEIIEQADDAGTPIFSFADHVDLLPFAGEEHAEDPHIWTDPTRIAEALPSLGGALGEVDGVDVAAVDAGVGAYIDELSKLDTDIEAAVAGIPPGQRVLVTNHEALGYFADRYGFEVVGTVIPSGTTLAEPSSAELEDLAQAIEDQGVPAIFGETTQSTRLADALAESLGDDIEVVELYTESLGEPDSGAETYVGLMRTDAGLIAGALT